MRQKGSRRRGSAVIEAALVLLPTVALILAIIDFSVAVFIRNSLMNAAREGVRYGVTSRSPSGSHDRDIRTVVRRYAMGFLDNEPDDRIQIQYFTPDLLAETNVNAAGNILQVRIPNYPWVWMAPVLRNNQTLSFSAASAGLMEPQPAGPPPR